MEQDELIYRSIQERLIVQCGYKTTKVINGNGGMILLVTGGIGYYQEEGKPAQILRKGDVVNIEPGVRHWHGAAPDSWFSQIVIFDSNYTPDADAPEETPVTDEEYENLETEEYTGRTITPDNEFMFERAPEAMTADTFSGPAYVSSLIGADNAAGAPDLHYVVFDPGVINNWHTHEGGQILIATDGIGTIRSKVSPSRSCIQAMWHSAAGSQTLAWRQQRYKIRTYRCQHKPGVKRPGVV